MAVESSLGTRRGVSSIAARSVIGVGQHGALWDARWRRSYHYTEQIVYTAITISNDLGERMNELGDMLKKLRESRGLSLNALAQKLKVSTSYLWRLENGLS